MGDSAEARSSSDKPTIVADGSEPVIGVPVSAGVGNGDAESWQSDEIPPPSFFDSDMLARYAELVQLETPPSFVRGSRGLANRVTRGSQPEMPSLDQVQVDIFIERGKWSALKSPELSVTFWFRRKTP